MHRSIVRVLALAVLLAAPAAAHAQGARSTGSFGGPYFQVTPFVGHVWGGAFPTDNLSGFPAGRLRAAAGIGWGLELGWSPGGASWLTGTYMRQDTEVEFIPSGSSTGIASEEFAFNYIHVGGRQLFGRGRVQPYIGGGLGLVVYDPKEQSGTNTQFSMSLEGGAQAMFGTAERVGLRAHLRGWWGFVPNGSIVVWCNIWGFCAAGEGTSTVGQGEVSLGAVIRF
jgi:hypothetical protein